MSAGTRSRSVGPAPVEVFDRALRGERCEVLWPDGRSWALPTPRWAALPDPTDHALFLAVCEGPTLDVGCGPGRLAGALAARGIAALGIDVSAEAVRQARRRGAVALQRDVFDDLPGSGRWHYLLLADGNVGIGGDPVSLLSRVRDLVCHLGRVLVEVAPPGNGLRTDLVQLRLGRRVSRPFAWATVSADVVGSIARASGLELVGVDSRDRRWVATLRRTAGAR
ncbi:MAG: class I SAM-dependent methyltransferase [Nocardioidaceae bacterium]